MTFLDVVLCALIRGIGDVLPLSASGHLAFLPALAANPQAFAAVSAAAYAGCTFGLMLFFWRDLGAMAAGIVRLAKGRPDAGARLLLKVIAGTLPALALGAAFLAAAGGVGGTATVAGAMLVFGFFLLVADRIGVTVKRIEHMGTTAAIAIGLLQAAALIPGVSRTGLTITAARLMGYERPEAVRFSLLLAIPLFAAQAGWATWRLSRDAQITLSADLALAAALAGLSAMAATAALLAWVQRRGFTPFAVWRMALGAAILLILVWRRSTAS
ncbi:MAG: undecaprenyl-diphosphate phosphatase [Solirubrobacterales bacterium]